VNSIPETTPTYIKKIKTIPGYYWHPHKNIACPPFRFGRRGVFPTAASSKRKKIKRQKNAI